MDDNEAHIIRAEMFDGCVNPLANILCNFLSFQVGKNFISKNEAKYIIASSIDIINKSDVHEEIKDMGADMLMRMVKAIDSMQIT